jgi:hypothetical protein
MRAIDFDFKEVTKGVFTFTVYIKSLEIELEVIPKELFGFLTKK